MEKLWSRCALSCGKGPGSVFIGIFAWDSRRQVSCSSLTALDWQSLAPVRSSTLSGAVLEVKDGFDEPRVDTQALSGSTLAETGLLWIIWSNSKSGNLAVGLMADDYLDEVLEYGYGTGKSAGQLVAFGVTPTSRRSRRFVWWWRFPVARELHLNFRSMYYLEVCDLHTPPK